jgi:cell division septation protein DedD
MENYILNLLKENSRVVIPEFGAFIIRQQNPPEIAFNSLLTFNDGILTEYVCRKSGISFLEASAKVSDYVEKLKTELQIHNRLTFNEIGWLWTDESGEKQFTPWKGGGRIQAETPSPMKDLGTILKEADIIEKSGTEVIPDSPIIQSAEQVPFVLDDTLKDVDIDATKDDLLNKPDEDNLLKGDNSAESFSLEESVSSVPEDHIKPETADPGISVPEDRREPKLSADPASEKLLIPKIDLSETLQEFQQEESQAETKNPKIEIRFKHVMPAEETVISQDSDMKAQSMEGETDQPIMDEPRKPLDQVWQEIDLKSTDTPKPHREKKKGSWIIPVLIIFAILSMACAAWLVFPDQIKNILNPDRQSSEATAPEEEAMEDSEMTPVPDNNNEQLPAQGTTTDLKDNETPLQTETPVIQSEIQPVGKKYYVVAGCFRSQLNAEKYVAELRDKGFSAELFGTHDNLYAVSFSSFSSRSQALDEMNRIRETTEPKAWILLY